jgi:hypothetical protein
MRQRRILRQQRDVVAVARSCAPRRGRGSGRPSR